MKLIVQVPCYNEEDTLPLVLKGIPRQIPGVDEVRALIIDDGSVDRTVEVAREYGADYIVRHAGNKGLARAFRSGLDACLRLDADIIVNTDGDNQYPQEDIPRLIAPVLSGEADIVIGDRQTWTIAEFSPLKKLLQAWGSRVVRAASGTSVTDAPSGFRAYTREAALRMVSLTSYSYTVETVIQAGKLGLTTINVPVATNPQTRPSRLRKGNWDFVKKQGATILRLYTVYEPLRTFFYLSLPFILVGLLLIVRFLILQFIPGETGIGRHVQSVVIGGTFLTLGLVLFVLGVLADLIAANRRLTEEALYRLRKLELSMEQPSIFIECVSGESREVVDSEVGTQEVQPDSLREKPQTPDFDGTNVPTSPTNERREADGTHV
jgi:glycosyltransferase involved in cell wall biosynthesis